MTFSSTRAIVLILLTIAPCLLSGGCGHHPDRQTPTPEIASQLPWLEDATTELGLDFVHDAGPIDGQYFLPQINGSGAAVFDFDNDGSLDIYLLQGGGPDSHSTSELFRQLPGGKFQNVSKGSGLDINGYNTGVAVADVNNDGWLDVLVAQYLGAKLFLNQQNGTFQDSSEQAGLSNPYWGMSASFLDYDRDGWLDVVIVNYVAFDESRRCTVRGGKRDFCRPNVFQGTASRLYRNRAVDEAGAWLGYEDRTDASGLGKLPGPGMGVVCADFSGDGWPDIFISNDMQPNHLWINQRNGVFQEEAITRGLAYNARGDTLSNMGVAYGDVDGDGLADLFVTLFTNERHALWKQEPRGSFLEQTATSGLAQSHWHGTGWGTVLADIDQDGALDIALVNGFVDARDTPGKTFWSAYMDRNQIFANDGSGHFRDISLDNPAFCDVPNVGRGLCQGDIDGDGALDLLVTQIGGPARILRNVAPHRGHWLMVRAVDPALQRDAIGAEIRIEAGAKRWLGLVQPGQSFQCSNDPRVHFGLGAVTHVDFVEVAWPDGSTERFPCSAVDCVVEIQRGSGRTSQAKSESRP